MFTKLLVFTFLAIGVSCRYVFETKDPIYVIYGYPIAKDREERLESIQPGHLNLRVRRDVNNPDSISDLEVKLPIDTENVLSLDGEETDVKPGGDYESAFGTKFLNPLRPTSSTYGGGVDYRYKDKFDASLSIIHTDDENKFSRAGKAHLLHNDDHDLSANIFDTKTMSLNSLSPSSSTYGAGLDYKFKDKLDVSLGITHTDDEEKFIGAGKVNLLNNDGHDLTANIFGTKTMSLNSLNPSSNTYGGGLDYKFKDKLDASLGMTHTDDADKFSGVGKVNLLHNDNHDLSANIFGTKTIPFDSLTPSFSTYGGGLDYKFKQVLELFQSCDS